MTDQSIATVTKCNGLRILFGGYSGQTVLGESNVV